MVKSKNHTNHNQNKKNHKNGIKRIARNRYSSQKGLNQILRKNNRRARKFDPTIKKEINLELKIERMRKAKQQILLAIKARIEKQNLRKQKMKEKSSKKSKKKRKNKKKK